MIVRPQRGSKILCRAGHTIASNITAQPRYLPFIAMFGSPLELTLDALPTRTVMSTLSSKPSALLVIFQS